MKLTKLYEISFDKDEVITATLANANELIVLFNSGSVVKYHIKSKKQQQLFSVKSKFTYSDGGFDVTAKSSIYTLDDIVVVVNDYKKHGYIYYPEKYNALHLWRQDYHADISCYPIALFKDDNNIPHIIYGADWNHLQIMNLDTRQILTAAKSLIEENAEERHIEFYKKNKEENAIAWPRPYDYFFGKLHMSPDNKNVLSAGWVWGSFDAYNIYNVKNFINNHRISDIRIDGWEHENRAVCWLDSSTIAVAYNPKIEEEEAAGDALNEIHLYKLSNNKTELQRKIKVEASINIVDSQMFYNKNLDALLVFSKDEGVVILSLEGQVLYENKTILEANYSSEMDMFLTTTKNSIAIYKITK